jgi:hypothetical protein
VEEEKERRVVGGIKSGGLRLGKMKALRPTGEEKHGPRRTGIKTYEQILSFQLQIHLYPFLSASSFEQYQATNSYLFIKILPTDLNFFMNIFEKQKPPIRQTIIRTNDRRLTRIKSMNQPYENASFLAVQSCSFLDVQCFFFFNFTNRMKIPRTFSFNFRPHPVFQPRIRKKVLRAGITLKYW